MIRNVPSLPRLSRPLQGDQLAEVVREVAGVSEVATVARLPEKVLLADVFAGITEPLLTGVVPFGLAEANVAGSPLVTATIDFADHQHAVATGAAGAGLSAWARAMMLGIMRSYRPDEATIILIEHRRSNVGVVPSDNWLAAYASNPQHIADVVKDLCALLEQRRPPADRDPRGAGDEAVLGRPRVFRRDRRAHGVERARQPAGGPGSVCGRRRGSGAAHRGDRRHPPIQHSGAIQRGAGQDGRPVHGDAGDERRARPRAVSPGRSRR